MSVRNIIQAAAGVADPLYIESVFSTWLYTGNGSTQTITNNIDLANQGGLTWIRRRGSATDHHLADTARGATKYLISNTTGAEQTNANAVTSFNNNGFSLGNFADVNSNGGSFVSWTFRKAPKFFDVVTYTGNGTAGRTVAHNLGSAPGCIIVKNLANGWNWIVYHRSINATKFLELNNTIAAGTEIAYWNNTEPTASVFTVGDAGSTNDNGATYVAYLFAHDSGGFGLSGNENVISCGSYTGNGSATGPTITLGWEPQWVLIKQATSGGTRWTITDNMRGFPVASSGQQILEPNTTNADIGVMYIQPTSTGFRVVDSDADVNTNGSTYIYIAIRRPNKPPTTGTQVYNAKTITGTNATYPLTGVGFAPDLLIASHRNNNAITHPTYWDKLRGRTQYITSSSTAAEANTLQSIVSFDNDGITLGSDGLDLVNKASGTEYVHWLLRRAPGFFDVVCYTGDSTLGRAVSHNLGVVPELMIVKNRNNTENWVTYSAATGNANRMILNSTAASSARAVWANTTPTSTNFYVGGSGVLGETNFSSYTYVAYLFASCTGVSKVGSYTGNGSNQTINCGFSAGARFVLIKATSTTGNWAIFDSSRGIVSGNDPFLRLNSTAAEVTGEDAVDPVASGFVVNQTTESLNASGVSYLFFAIA